jgi:acetyl-CoA carboxylase biotin carboxyl carrier protein
MKINKKIIEELVKYLIEFNLTDLEYSEGSTKVKVSRIVNSSKTSHATIVEKTPATKVMEDSSLKVTSPIVGTAYLASEPGGKNFVEVGQKIKKGETIMIVEAMKTMNHVPSTHDGVISKVLVKDGEPVEFAQPLILLK